MLRGSMIHLEPIHILELLFPMLAKGNGAGDELATHDSQLRSITRLYHLGQAARGGVYARRMQYRLPRSIAGPGRLLRMSALDLQNASSFFECRRQHGRGRRGHIDPGLPLWRWVLMPYPVPSRTCPPTNFCGLHVLCAGPQPLPSGAAPYWWRLGHSGHNRQHYPQRAPAYSGVAA